MLERKLLKAFNVKLRLHLHEMRITTKMRKARVREQLKKGILQVGFSLELHLSIKRPGKEVKNACLTVIVLTNKSVPKLIYVSNFEASRPAAFTKLLILH